MINDPKVILEICEELENTTKEELNEAIQEVDKIWERESMHKADEMFEKLKFNKIEDNNTWIRYKSKEDYAEIIFDKTDKEICTCSDNDECIFISMQELQAINEKVKELGWIKN